MSITDRPTHGTDPDRAREAGVLVGRDGFLFLLGDTNRLLDQHTGRIRLSRRWMDQVAGTHRARVEAVAAVGGTYLHVVVPNKETVLAGHLPDEFRYQSIGSTPVVRYLRTAEDIGRFTYFEPDLLKKFEPVSVFRIDDTHWTPLGAFQYTAHALSTLPAFGTVVGHFLAPMDEAVETQPGDLGRRLPGFPPSRYKRLVPRLPAAELVFFNGLRNRGRVKIYLNRDAPDPRTVLVAHDSFGDRLYEILPFVFARVVFVHTPDFDPELVSLVRPDLYLNVQIERFFVRAPRNRLRLRREIEELAPGDADLAGRTMAALRSAFPER